MLYNFQGPSLKTVLFITAFIIPFILLSQSGTGKYAYTSNELLNESATYKEGAVLFTLGFDFNWISAKALNDEDILNCEGIGGPPSFSYRNKGNDVQTIWFDVKKNYDMIICFCPYTKTSTKIGKNAEISIFYMQDGMLLNYPDKNKTIYSGANVELKPYSDGSNIFLQKIDLGDGNYILIKDSFYIYGIKIKELNCVLKVTN